jgi:hypothetical protein
MDDYISNKKHMFCGWSRKILQAKVTCNTRSKSGGRVGISKRNSTSKIKRRSTSSALILGRSFLKTVIINIGKWEIMFDIDGVRSAFKSTMIRGMQHDSC